MKPWMLSILPLLLPAQATFGLPSERVYEYCRDGKRIYCDLRPYGDGCYEIGDCLEDRLICTARDFGRAPEWETIKQEFSVKLENGQSARHTVGQFTATVRIYDPMGKWRRRIVLDIRRPDEQGNIQYASAFVDDVVPPYMQATVSLGEQFSGSLSCRPNHAQD